MYNLLAARHQEGNNCLVDTWLLIMPHIRRRIPVGNIHINQFESLLLQKCTYQLDIISQQKHRHYNSSPLGMDKLLLCAV